MKILAIGDFHGEIPKNLRSFIEKNKFDLIISIGDYFPFSYRKIWFEHCYGKKLELWEVIGKKKVKDYILKDLKTGEKVLKFLDSLKIPVITVVGNIDYTRINDQYKKDIFFKYKWKWEGQDFFSQIIKKYRNIKRFDYSYFKFGDFIFIGAYGGSSTGHVKSKAFRKYKKILDNLFLKFKKENKERRLIFVSHNVPYKTKLDLITSKEAHKKAKGKHFGSKLVRRAIQKHQPFLYLGGHIHESWGSDKLGKTLMINPGAIHEKRTVVLNINEKGKIKTKFVRLK